MGSRPTLPDAAQQEFRMSQIELIAPRETRSAAGWSSAA